MDIKMSFALLAGKCARIGLRLLGREASSFPGAVALKICPDLPSRLKLPEKIIAVTGSNGKTTTTEMIYSAAKKAGVDLICNAEGSNQIEGVTALFVRYASLCGKVKAKAALIESDERFCQYTFRHFTPSAIVITNLYRDQITRNGHSEFVRKELAKGLPEKSLLILNADDPVSAVLGEGRKCVYYGLEAGVLDEAPDAKHRYDDGAVCPRCLAPMQYTRRVVSQAGDYACSACGFSRQKPDHAVTALKDKKFVMDGQYPVRAQMRTTVFAYDLAAAYAALVDGFGVAPKAAADGLDGYKLTHGRFRTFSVKGHLGHFTLTKHENSMAYNGALKSLADAQGEATLVVIVDQLSRKYSANDMSWLWDIDFELAADEKIRRILLGGRFAHDLALRFAFAGVEESRITVAPDLDQLMDSLYADPVGEIYVMTCFTDVNKFTGRLRKEGGK